MLHIPDRFVEHALEVTLGEGRTFEVLVRTDLLGDGQRLLVRDGLHFASAQGVSGRSVVSQVQLGSDKDDGDVGSMVLDFGIPLRQLAVARFGSLLVQNIEWRTHRSTECKSYLGLDVIERRRADDGKADQEDISLGVGQRSESIVILLTSSIPQTQANRSTIHHNTRSVVIKAGYWSTGGFSFRERRKGNREMTGERAQTRLGCIPQGRRWSYRKLGDMSIESQVRQFISRPPTER